MLGLGRGRGRGCGREGMGGPRRRRGMNRCFWLSKRVFWEGKGWKGKNLVFRGGNL